MRVASWMMIGLASALVSGLVAGCGSKPEPPAGAAADDAAGRTASAVTPAGDGPRPGSPTEPPGGGPVGPSAGDTSEPPAPKPVHELDPDKHTIPAAPVTGRLAGAEFNPAVSVEGDQLVFQVAKPGSPIPEWSVRLKLGTGPDGIGNRRIVVRPEMPAGDGVPEVMIQTPKRPELQLYGNGYALTLELGKRQAGRLPGRVYLALPDEEKSFFAGRFEADFPRQPIEPPGPDDLPLVTGAVTISHAAPGAVVMVGYAATPDPMTTAFGSAEIALGDPVIPPRWTQSVYDKPRVTNLIAGNGKDVPSRYEHSKLTPGRYLVFAALKNGPAAWKWVDVPANGMVTADLSIDARQTGGLEIGAPLEAAGKVQLAPADDPGRPPTDPNLFVAICWQLGWEQQIVARKALYKNLAPGRYEVRTAGRSAVVEVVAGKTVEFDFDKKAPPPKPEPAPEPKPKPTP